MLLVPGRRKQSANCLCSARQADAVYALAQAAAMASVLLWGIEHAIGEDFIIRGPIDSGLLIRKHLLLLLLKRRDRVRICLLLLRLLRYILKRHPIEIHGQRIAAAGIEDCRRRRRMVGMVTVMNTIL